MSQAVFLGGMGGDVPVDVATSYVTNAGTAVPAANVLNVLATVVSPINIPFEFTGSGNTVTGAIQLASAESSPASDSVGLAVFNSNQFSVDGSGFVSLLGTSAATKLTGNSGTATPTAGNINVVTANSTVKFIGSGSTLTQDFNLNNLVLGTSLSSLTTGTLNAGFGASVFSPLTSGSSNTSFGTFSSASMATSTGNSAFGTSALEFQANGGGNNSAFGQSCLEANDGQSNSAFGSSAGNGNLGSFNAFFGASAGINYRSTESSNISIMHNGVSLESNTMRIGVQGSGNGQVNRCFISGINGITNSNAQNVTINTSTGQLGSANPTSFSLNLSTSSGNMADSSTYYFQQGASIANANINLSGTKLYIPVATTLRSFVGSFFTSGTLASSENSSLDILVNGTLAANITSTLELTATNVNVTNTSFSIPLNVGDYVQIRMTNPAWATNPLTTSVALTVFFY